MHLYYAQKVDKDNVYAQCLEECDIGQVIQQKFTHDGRCLISLESSGKDGKQRVVKIYYNKYNLPIDEIEKPVEYVPKHLDADALQYQQVTSSINLDVLAHIPIRLGHQIASFQEVHNGDKIAILISTNNCLAYLWVEQVIPYNSVLPSESGTDDNYDQPMSFSCVHTFKLKKG